MHNIIQTGS